MAGSWRRSSSSAMPRGGYARRGDRAGVNNPCTACSASARGPASILASALRFGWFTSAPASSSIKPRLVVLFGLGGRDRRVKSQRRLRPFYSRSSVLLILDYRKSERGVRRTGDHPASASISVLAPPQRERFWNLLQYRTYDPASGVVIVTGEGIAHSTLHGVVFVIFGSRPRRYRETAREIRRLRHHHHGAARRRPRTNGRSFDRGPPWHHAGALDQPQAWQLGKLLQSGRVCGWIRS